MDAGLDALGSEEADGEDLLQPMFRAGRLMD